MQEKLPMDVIHPKAAGIDVGSKSHFIAIGQGIDEVKEVGIYTSDHKEVIQWLKDSDITTIAMESTGSYWQTLFTSLQCAGFEVLLVSGRDVKNLKGKKTDVLDCQWIQKLHSLGLLKSSFLSDEFTRQLRTYYTHRQGLIRQSAKYTNKMQGALRLMNIRLDVAIRDINGKTGMNILRAIIAGERNPITLASLADIRVKKSQEEIAKSLEGEWKEDLLFILAECFSIYEYYQQKIDDCDNMIHLLLEQYNQTNNKEFYSLKPIKNRKKHKNSLSFDLRPYSHQILGTDLYEIDNIGHSTVLSILSTLGGSIEKFPTSKQFVSWLRLAPNNKISGGRIISSRTPKGKNQVSLALRQVANTIGNSKFHPLKNFFIKIAFRKGRGAAVTATARKLAIIIYNMIKNKMNYTPTESIDSVFDRNRKLQQIKKSIKSLELSNNEFQTLFTQEL